MRQPRPRRQPRLFDAPPLLPVVRLPVDVQAQLRHALVQWMQAVAKRLRGGRR